MPLPQNLVAMYRHSVNVRGDSPWGKNADLLDRMALRVARGDAPRDLLVPLDKVVAVEEPRGALRFGCALFWSVGRGGGSR